MQGLSIFRSYLWIVKLSISEVGLMYIVSIDILLFHVSEYFKLLLMLLRQWRKWDLMIRSPFHRYRIYQNDRVANHSQPLGDKQREKREQAHCQHGNGWYRLMPSYDLPSPQFIKELPPGHDLDIVLRRLGIVLVTNYPPGKPTRLGRGMKGGNA